jgi:acyl-CoA synthetase (AMP-forming)/AMP-acid ligase II
VLSERQIGEIVVQGRSLAAGYFGGAIDDTLFRNGGLYTGDIGFIDGGQLFVFGRLGDSLKVRGLTVFAEDLETALASLEIPAQRAAAILGSFKGEPTAVVLLERSASTVISQVRSIVRSRVGDATVLVLEVPQGTIRRTSSGKVRRRELWRAFCEGRIEPIARY